MRLDRRGFLSYGRWIDLQFQFVSSKLTKGSEQRSAANASICVLDNEAPGFAPVPLPLAWVTPKCRLIYCKILVFK